MIHLHNPDADTVRVTVTQVIAGVRNRAALARQIGVNRATIYKWLEGKAPSLPELAKLAQATKTSIRIDLGAEFPDEPPANLNDRMTLVEEQMGFLMKTAVSNQEAILKLLAGDVPFLPDE